VEDYSIVKDEYFYKREKAFKDIASVAKATHSHTIREDDPGKKHKRSSPDRQDPSSGKSRNLNCPFDGERLETVSVDYIKIDYCPVCYGIWFDLGELEILLRKKMDIKGKFAQLFDHSLELHDATKPDCPVCRNRMIPHRHYYTNLRSFGCETCGGLWLDSGEFAALYVERKGFGKTADLLSDVVGKHIDIRM
jgi:Zn-finger nucleic acid-binding protein